MSTTKKTKERDTLFAYKHNGGKGGIYMTLHGKERMVYPYALYEALWDGREKVRLCDPTDNSINEKLSRIRKSFCAEVHESVADSYVVKGSRGEDRYISLDEELIELGVWGR